MAAEPKQTDAAKTGGLQNAISINTAETSKLGSELKQVPNQEQTAKRAAARVLENDAWLSSNVNWDNRFGAEWVGKEILGKGGFGLAGRWEYVGKPEPGKEWESYIKDIVVKQSMVPGLESESEFLSALNATGSTHFPRVYRFADGYGAGTDEKVDKEGKYVQRLFLELCQGGDLGKVNRRAIDDPSKRLTEVQLWSIFLCLAKAIAVMEYGSESAEPKPGWNRICHFDIKPANLFLGGHDSEQHSEMNQVKTGDFGLAMPMPNPEGQTLDINRSLAGRGTSSFRAPEQEYGFARDQKFATMVPHILNNKDLCYGAHTNIYMMACAMWCLMTADRRGPGIRPKFVCSTLSQQLLKGETVGGFLIQTKYSTCLKSLVLECLMMRFKFRPSVQELLERTRQGLYDALNAYGFEKTEHNLNNPMGDPPPTPTEWKFGYEEPNLAKAAPPIYSIYAQQPKRKRSEAENRRQEKSEQPREVNIANMLALALAESHRPDALFKRARPPSDTPEVGFKRIKKEHVSNSKPIWEGGDDGYEWCYEDESEAAGGSEPTSSNRPEESGAAPRTASGPPAPPEVWDGTFYINVFVFGRPAKRVRIVTASPEMIVRQFKRSLKREYYVPLHEVSMRVGVPGAVPGSGNWNIEDIRELQTIPGWGTPQFLLELVEQFPSEV